MKRLPRGGHKINYSLYLSAEDRERIKKRAEELGMANAYYLVTLADLDIQLGLLEHIESGGSIELVTGEDVPEPEVEVQEELEQGPVQPGQMPVPEDVAEVTAQFQENLAKAPRQEKIELPSDDTIAAAEKTIQQTQAVLEQTGQQPPAQQVQRPPMRSLQDIMQQQGGAFAVPGAGSTAGNIRDPGPSVGEQGADRVLQPGWQDRLHGEMRKNDSGEAAMRKQILDNLPPPPKKKEEG